MAVAENVKQDEIEENAEERAKNVEERAKNAVVTVENPDWFHLKEN